MDDLINLDAEGLASWFASADLFQEACKLTSLANREPDEDATEIEAFAVENIEPTDVSSTHPSIIVFIRRQSINGTILSSPRFVVDTLLPYLQNIMQEMSSMTLPKLLDETDQKRAFAFDANPDTHSLLEYLEVMLNARRNDDIGSESIIEHSARSLAMLHYAFRVMESGNTLPGKSPPPSTNISPSNLRKNSSGFNLPSSLPASLPASPHHRQISNAADEITPAADQQNNNTNNSAGNNEQDDDDDVDLPPMMLPSDRQDHKTPALPKQEPLSGSRRQVRRRWQEWRDSGKKAFGESNLPVSVGGVFYTPLHCLTEALEEFLVSTDGGVAARMMSSGAVGGGTNTLREIGSFSLSPGGKANSNNTRKLDLNFDDDSMSPPDNNNNDLTNETSAVNDDGEDLATSEGELWSLLSKAMPLGKSAVTINGQMITKETAMANAVQADTMNAERWLDLARVLPSETGKKRISKSRKNRSNKSKSATGANGSPRRNFGNLLNFGATPNSAKRKFNFDFDDGSNNNNNAGSPQFSEDFSLSTKSQRTRETPPMVDGRVMTRVHAYAESLKLDNSKAEVWSELGLHMPLNPPNDSVFINNSSYTSRRCHETALESDSSLADSWLDLGWQLLEDKKSTVINSNLFNATDCFREALIRVPSDLGEAWSLLAQSLPDNASEKVEIPGEATFTKLDCFRQALKLDPRCISAWIGLGRMLPRGSSTTVNGKEFSQLGLFYHALEMDDSDAVAWNGLGAMLGPIDKAVFRGEALTRRQCYLKALECDPYLARVWNNLGLDLGDPRVDRNDENHIGGRTVDGDYVHFAGKKYDSKAAFIRALHCEGGNVSTSWVNLGMLLAPKSADEGGTSVVCGKTVDKKRCYYEAVRANERNAIAWNNLGAVMSPDEKVVVNKVEKDKLECYRHALENDETLSNAWYNVVCVIMNKEKQRPDRPIEFKVRGVKYNKIKCMLNAVETNPENGNAWDMLKKMMEEAGEKEFKKRDGGVVTLKECKRMIEKYPPKE